MKILITGISGFIGSMYFNYFNSFNKYEVYGTYRSHLPSTDHNEYSRNIFQADLLNKKKIEDILNTVKPEIIINCAGNKNVRQLENNEQKAYSENTELLKSFEKYINTTESSCFIELSSDYVFNGKKPIYHENDLPSPATVYGKSKYEAEKLLQRSFKKYLIIRPSAVIGKKSNFLGFIIRELKNKNQIEMFDNLLFTPTNSLQLLDNTKYLIDNNINNDIYHISNNRIYSRYDFALMTADLLDLDKNLIIKKSADTTQTTLKSSCLSADKIIRKSGIIRQFTTENIDINKLEAE